MTMPPVSPARPITVVLVDDEPLMRQSLRIVIDSQDDLCVTGEASNGDEAVRVARMVRPDVVLMDIRMPETDGIHASRAITSDPEMGGVRVLVLSMYELDEYVYGALHAGASGFLLKDAHPATLLDSIRRVHDGEALFAPTILRKLVEHYVSAEGRALNAQADPVLGRLTPREKDVLELVAHGYSNDEIRTQLCISGNTVKTHISNLLAKLHARDRAQLVIVAYEKGLVSVSAGPVGESR